MSEVYVNPMAMRARLGAELAVLVKPGSARIPIVMDDAHGR